MRDEERASTGRLEPGDLAPLSDDPDIFLSDARAPGDEHDRGTDSLCVGEAR
ncbi:MAG TPA: hypothetical protein VEJ87_00905 [Acidimicrobiales bacterium]|nr:hypothetical protein [Acidimicrobiales bacterium]